MTDRPVSEWLTRRRIILYSSVMLVLYGLFFLAWAGISRRFAEFDVVRPGPDFAVFWSASYLMLHGSPWQAYDHRILSDLALTLLADFQRENFVAWLYPPTYLLMVTPLALLPFSIAYPCFIGASLVGYVIAVRRISNAAGIHDAPSLGWIPLIASPCIFVTATFGQNAMLTAACAALAVYWIDRKPIWAGICIGLLTVKPQMALLFPFVLIAVRAWRVLASAAVSAILLSGIAVLVCGVESLRLFAVNAGLARSIILEHGVVFWFASPTSFATLRLSEVPLVLAYVGHGFVAVVAIAATCGAWKSTRDTRLRSAVLFVSTLISNPYLWHYELAWLGVALSCIAAIGLRDGWLRGEQAAVMSAWLLPVYEMLNPWLKLPQIGPFVLLFTLLLILRRVRISAQNASLGGT
ncbi:hypothetical protein WS71_30780 [Burkholderia mayonis]|uniref:DUF2029 domain-containing protein n=2 Tax=Burkholderia mayonis TaxID=1385591 RepID=A0A1B4G696_9BURK|nr:glycosyltransferase family 87 protein [Burkholderia mayonis]AOJ11447.1 hypothetical protein WS71_30780 [Burkholderia mayonis]KVE46422.1 hypothetical protein WS71_21945 [Burkholderia mayonis]